MNRKLIKQLILIAIVIVVICSVAIATEQKPTLVVDGTNNKAYSSAINTIWKNGLKLASEETCRLANSHIDDVDPAIIVLIDPSANNVADFYTLAVAKNAKLVISSSDEESLKAKLFDLNFKAKQFHFDNETNWDPDKYENLGKGYSY